MVGAGVSMPRPANLPSGSQFLGVVFDLLTKTGPTFLDRQALSKLRRKVQRDLRLEIFFETLAREISPHIIFQVFKMFRAAEVNFTHLALVALAPRIIVTTNQDLLIERAAAILKARPSILHLHGRCDEMGTIITLISQYLGGLDKRLFNSFRRAVVGADVIVLGSSGRDRDVMPALVAAEPRSVTWILHKRSKIYPELERVKHVLGLRLKIVNTDTQAWLESHLGDGPSQRLQYIIRGLTPGAVNELPLSVRNAFRRIGIRQRNRALAKLLEHLGWYGEARRIYLRLGRKGLQTGPRMLLDLGWVNGRVLGFGVAMNYYARAREYRGASAWILARSLLLEADTLRNSAKYVETLEKIRSLELLLPELRRMAGCNKKRQKEYWLLRGWSQNAKAGILRIEGYPSKALDLYRSAEIAFSKARDISGRIDVLTW